MGRFTDFLNARQIKNPYTEVLARHLDTVEASRDRGRRILGGSVGEIPAFVKDATIDVGLGTYLGVPGELAGQFFQDVALAGNAELERSINPTSRAAQAYGAGGVDAYAAALDPRVRGVVGAQGTVLSMLPDFLLGGTGTTRAVGANASKLKLPRLTRKAKQAAQAAPTPQQAAQAIPEGAVEKVAALAAKADDVPPAAAPDLSLGNLNDRFNAAERGEEAASLGTPATVKQLSTLLNNAYGDKRRFAVPALLKRLGAKVEPDGRFTRDGADITDKVYAFLEARPGLKPKEADKALAALADEVAGKPATALPGGDIAAGGGGMGIVPYMLPKSAASALVGAGAGGIAGGIADDDGGVDGILAGMAVGAGLGAGASKLPGKGIKDSLALMHSEGKRTFGEALQTGGFKFSSLAADWKADKVETIRGLGLDALSGRVRALVNSVPMGNINGSYRSLLDTWRSTGKFRPYDDELAEMAALNGLDPEKYDWARLLGQGYMAGGEPVTKRLHPLASAGAGAAYSFANFGVEQVPVLGQVVGAARGAARPYTSGAYRAMNDLEQYATRNAAFKQEARALLERAHAAFAGTLRGAGMDPSLLSRTDGLYSADEVAAKYGDEAGAAWQAVLDQIYGVPSKKAIPEKAAVAAKGKKPAKPAVAAVPAEDQVDGLAGKFVKGAFGDYGNPNQVVKLLDRIAPFSRYATGQVRPLAQMALQHPGAALALAHWFQSDQKRAREEGRPGYQVGTLRVDTETPGIGKLVRAQLGGAEGEGRINPTASTLAISGGQVGATDQFEDADTPYKWAEAVLGTMGFSFNPAIAAAAFVVGGEYGTDRAPGAQSRTSRIEQALPGPTTPSGRGILNSVREAFGNDPDTYDPVDLLAKEIIFERTGKPASDPSNAAYMPQLLDPDSPLMQEARRRYEAGGAVANTVSLLSPITAQTNTDEKVAYRRARVEQEGAEKKTGAAAMYRDPKYPAGAIKNGKKVDPRLYAWERKNAALKRAAPKAYSRLRFQFIEENGIKE